MAVVDIKLLQIMRQRQHFNKLYGDIPPSILEEHTKTILDAYATYFRKFPEHQEIDNQTFLPRFHGWHPTMDDTQRTVYNMIIGKTVEPIDDATAQVIMGELHELTFANEVANLLAKHDGGDMVENLPHVISDTLDKFKAKIGKREDDYITTSIDELLEQQQYDVGISWRLAALNQGIRRLRGGDFAIIAGRPDQGKTTFMASEITHMAGQLPPEKTVLWLNNEGSGKNLLTRIWQAALGVERSQMLEWKQDGSIKQRYSDAVGSINKIRVADVHDRNIGFLESMIERHNAGIVIYDMLDNVKGFGDEARTDQRLEELYKRARELCVKYDCIGFATSQISSEGDNMRFPGLSCLKDSKTGKQGACDLQLMIGSINDQGMQGMRFLGTPKNKLRREGRPGNIQAEVAYKPGRARYEDIVHGT